MLTTFCVFKSFEIFLDSWERGEGGFLISCISTLFLKYICNFSIRISICLKFASYYSFIKYLYCWLEGGAEVKTKLKQLCIFLLGVFVKSYSFDLAIFREKVEKTMTTVYFFNWTLAFLPPEIYTTACAIWGWGGGRY